MAGVRSAHPNEHAAELLMRPPKPPPVIENALCLLGMGLCLVALVWLLTHLP